MHWVHSLQTKLTLSFVVLIVVVASVTFFYTFGETKKALKEIVRTELTAVAAMTAADLSGTDADELAALQKGDEQKPAFIRIQNKLKTLRASHPDFKYIYTMRKSGTDVLFLIDADYGDTTDPGAAIDEKYEDGTERMMEGFDRPTAENEFSTDKWGTLLSGYAPLKDSRGAIVGLVGIDMSSDLVLEKQRFLGNTISCICS